MSTDNTTAATVKTPAERQPCLHGAECDGRGLDCGPNFSRKKAAPKPAAELTEIRARAWATRRAKYGECGHYGSYQR